MTKEEKIENYLCSKGLSDKEIKSDTTGLRRITKEIILEAINWACSNLKEEQNKNFPPIQMICDSQECREATTDLGKCDQRVTIDDESLKYTTSRDFNSEYLTYTTTSTQDLKLDKEPTPFSQMICDSQGCREVDLLGRPITPINGVLETLMSPEQLRELAERIPARDEDVRESSFEVMLEDDVQTTLDNTLLYKCSACGKTYSGSTPIQCECGRKHGWIVLSSALQDDVNEALELHGRLKLGDSEAPDWADSKDKYILKINYDRDGVTQPSVDCEHPEWQCPKCGNQFYKFPYKGCFCGTKREEILSI